MKKQFTAFMIGLMLSTPVLAYEGEMGYFGGISTGYKLPTTTTLAQGDTQAPSRITLPYKENIYLTGRAVPVEGTIEFSPEVIDKTQPTGSYREVYTIRAEDAEGENTLYRKITLDTKYVYDQVTKQVTKTSEMSRWDEVISVEGANYRLEEDQSTFSKSIIEDHTPGVTYYRGDVSYRAAYKDVASDNGDIVMMEVNGPIYGYEHAFAKTETQKREIYIEGPQDGYYIEETPTYTTYKELQYGVNEPGAISFGGNYKEILRGSGATIYDIKVGDPGLYADETSGSVSVVDVPSLEQLPAVELSHLKGHPAETDIRKMYSMKIFTGDPRLASPNQVVTRGEYIQMLVRALKMPLEEKSTKPTFSFGGQQNQEAAPVVFTDVAEDDPLYPYMMAAYNAGLISGGTLNPGEYLRREEMIRLNVAAIGLERLGIATGGIYTPFIDDNLISQEGKSAVYAASRLGIINGESGYIYPTSKVTYADAAAFINQFLNYLRYELRQDYDEKIMM